MSETAATAAVSEAVPAPGRPPGEWWRMLLRGVGQLLITFGVVLLLFVGYELWGTNLYTNERQHELTQQIETQWQKPGVPDITKLAPVKVKEVPLGSGIAVLRIPRLGKDYVKVVVQGTGYEDLKSGPGHYPGTAMPGQVGNFSVAGHRTTYGAPFNELDLVRKGDFIVLETKDWWFTYRVEDIPGTNAKWQEIVDPGDVQVAFAVPDQADPNLKPKLKVLTFTTCNPKYSAAQRLVVHALLVDARHKSLGYPPALVG